MSDEDEERRRENERWLHYKCQMEAELKEYAENVANFYNHLIGKGIPPDHACAITSAKVHAEGRE